MHTRKLKLGLLGLLLLLFSLAGQAGAQVTISDNFDTDTLGLQSAWRNAGSADYKVVTAGAISGTQAFGTTTSGDEAYAFYQLASPQADFDMTYTFKYTGQSVELTPALRSSLDGQTCYTSFCLLSAAQLEFDFYARVAGVYHGVGGFLLLTGGLTVGDIINVHWQLTGNVYRVRAWKSTGSEPATWSSSTDTNNYITGTGYYGFRHSSSSAQSIDDLVMTGITPSGPPSATFSEIDAATYTGQPLRALIPATYSAGAGANLIIHCHGADIGQWNNDPALIGVQTRLITDGNILLGISNTTPTGGWGGRSGVEDYVAAYRYVIARYKVKKVVLMCQSMGGTFGWLLLADQRVPVAGMALIEPVQNLANMALGSYHGSVYGTFGVATDGSDFAAKTAGRDPVNLGIGYLPRVPVRFYASYGDNTVSQAQNADMMRARVAPFYPEASLFEATGDHGDATEFQPTDLSAFFSRCFAYGPAPVLRRGNGGRGRAGTRHF